MRVSRRFWVALSFLAAVHLVVLCAGFFAPYHYSTQNRAYPFAPPTRIHFIDSQGGWHWRPFVYAIVADMGSDAYKEDASKVYPLRFFVEGEEYLLANLLPTRRHLFVVVG